MKTKIPKGYKHTEAGLIPDDWKVKRVGDICDFIVPGRNKPKKFEGDIPWITTPDLEDGRSVAKSRLGLCISIDEAKKVGSKIVPAGSVIMSCAGELGIVAFSDNEIIINQQLHAFIPSSIIDGLFLLNAIKVQKKYIDGIATKTAVPYINKDNCNSIPIPLPPLYEQKAIAQALSDVDAAIAELDRLITKKRNIKQGAMQQLLTGKKRLPGFSGEWEVKTFRDVSLVNQGLQIAIEKRLKQPGPNSKKYITIQFLNNGKDVEYINGYSSSVCCNENDVLMTRTGNTGIVVSGVSGVFHNNFFKINFDRKSIDKNYLIGYLNLDKTHKLILAKAGTSTIPDLNHNDFYSIPIPLPTLSEQTALAQVLTDMDAEIEAVEQKRDKYKAIKQGMMQELLTGRTRLI